FGFGMAVKYFNRSAKDISFPTQKVENLGDMAGQVDILVAAVPAGAATHHIIDAKVLSSMKPSGHLINIARGDVVDEVALIAALEDGEIAGAGLDVYEFEPRVPASLIALQNVVLLPHLGTAALEVRTAMGLMAVDNLLAFDAGLSLPNAV
ncbi:MAG: NAD(P)-dependent oxidoreductase, partial [Paracoccaceae bacterium]